MDGPVLDLACGRGRHSRFFLGRGHDVVAVDRDLSYICDLMGCPRFRAIRFDLEEGRPFPLQGQHFAAVIVTNYLHRPILGDLVSVVRPGGAFIYETFAHGNEQFDGPHCSEYLLRPGELLQVVSGNFRVLAFEDVIVSDPRPKAVQRIAAVRMPE
jgi:SAM-dependent methyltransferase